MMQAFQSFWWASVMPKPLSSSSPIPERLPDPTQLLVSGLDEGPVCFILEVV